MTSLRPDGRGIGSSKTRFHPLAALRANAVFLALDQALGPQGRSKPQTPVTLRVLTRAAVVPPWVIAARAFHVRDRRLQSGAAPSWWLHANGKEMPHFTVLERAALEEICKHAHARPALEGQLATARVSRRKNTAVGFITYFAVDRNGPPLTNRWRVLGNVAVRFERPLLLALFMSKDGYADMLEATTAGDSTVGTDLSAVRFEIDPPLESDSKGSQ